MEHHMNPSAGPQGNAVEHWQAFVSASFAAQQVPSTPGQRHHVVATLVELQRHLNGDRASS
jgi:hypothetical protein